MSFWQDLAPWVRVLLVVGVVGVIYLGVARAAEMVPFTCSEGSHCSGLLCGECEPDIDAQERGFRGGSSAVAAEPAAE